MNTKNEAHTQAWAWILAHRNMIDRMIQKLFAGVFGGVEIEDFRSEAYYALANEFHKYDPNRCPDGSLWAYMVIRRCRRGVIRASVRGDANNLLVYSKVVGNVKRGRHFSTGRAREGAEGRLPGLEDVADVAADGRVEAIAELRLILGGRNGDHARELLRGSIDDVPIRKMRSSARVVEARDSLRAEVANG